jgi:predicted phosphodiesterase
MARTWSEAENWRFVRAQKIYENQYTFMLHCEDFGRSQYSLERRAIALRDYTPPKGTEKLPLRAETNPEEVYQAIVDHLKDSRRRGFVPEYFRVYKQQEEDSQVSGVNAELLRLLKKGPVSQFDLADMLDVPPRLVREGLEWLKGNQYLVAEDLEGITLAQPERHPEENYHVLPVDRLMDGGRWYKFGAIGDTHIGSKWERLDVLNALYEIFEGEGVTEVFHTGNTIEGEGTYNRQDIRVHGMENQVEYFLEHYPQRKGTTTRYITGDCHEGWYIKREGIDIGRRIEQSARDNGREDLVYLGHVEADIELKAGEGSSIMRIHHPGGGSAYAISYIVQKIVESYQGGEKPHILLCGHTHKADWGYPREVHCVQTGCTQDQSIFMRKKRLQAMVGGFIVKVQLGEMGEVVRFAPEFFPFYDKTFYEQRYNVEFGVASVS